VPHRLPHINLRVFTVLVFVSLPLYALAAVMVLGTGQAQLRDAFGLQLTDQAQQAAATVDSYVFRRVIDVSILARVPDVRAAAAAGSRPLDVAKARRPTRRGCRSLPRRRRASACSTRPPRSSCGTS
jgi:hypothetical protein